MYLPEVRQFGQDYLARFCATAAIPTLARGFGRRIIGAVATIHGFGTIATVPPGCCCFAFSCWRTVRAYAADHGPRVTIPAFPTAYVIGTVGRVPSPDCKYRYPIRAGTIALITTSYAGMLSGGVFTIFGSVTSVGVS